MLIAACAVLLLATIVPLIWPLLRARAGSTAAPAQAVYRDQLAELDQDLARNAISAEDAAAARAEISRRLLAASTSETPLTERAASPVVAALIAALVIAGGAAGYLVLGAPFFQVQPPPPDEASIAAMAPEKRAAMIRGMVNRLATRMETDQDNADGWMQLGRAWLMLGERDRSAAAYARAAALKPGDVEAPLQELAALLDATPMGTALPPRIPALVAMVTPLAQARPEALWYLGLAAARLGNRTLALDYWDRLLPMLPAEGEEHGLVENAIRALRGG